MYLQGLSQISGLPDFKNLILTGTTLPAIFNVATQSVLPTAPAGVALAQLYQYGNTIPAWSPFYSPAGAGDVFGQYESFVTGLQLQGNPDPSIDAAINSDRATVNAARAVYNADYTNALADYNAKNQAQPGLYRSFTDFIDRSTWGSQLSQDVAAITGAQSQLNQDMTRKYGSQYLPVQNAINMVNNVFMQESIGSGTLVMDMQTDSNANQPVPIFNSGPLGNPGYSQWLDQVVVGAGHGAPAQASITINQSAQQYDLSTMTFFSEGGGLADLGEFFWGTGEHSTQRSRMEVDTASSAFSVTVTMQSVYYLPISPGPWFSPSLLSANAEPQFFPDSPLKGAILWGPEGIFSLIPSGLVIAFRPSVSASFDSQTYQNIKTYAASQSSVFGIGPFFLGEYSEEETTSTNSVSWSDASNTIVMSDQTTVPKIIGITAATPNWTR
jgi:hypothetical protein